MMRAALTGTAVALLCLVPPLIHFVTGPLGPFIGGVVAGAQLRSRTDSTFALILMSALMAVMLAGAFTVIVGAAVVIISLFIETDTQFGLALLLTLVGVTATYAFGLGVMGSMLGAAFRGRQIIRVVEAGNFHNVVIEAKPTIEDDPAGGQRP